MKTETVTITQEQLKSAFEKWNMDHSEADFSTVEVAISAGYTLRDAIGLQAEYVFELLKEIE